MASVALGPAFRHFRDLFGAGTAAGMVDGQLLARYSASKDEAAFEALVIRHGPMVLATCRAVLRNEHDVEDAFQATFLVLARKAGSIRGGDALGGWLHRVARRASVRSSVQARKRRMVEAEVPARANPFDPRTDLAAALHEEVDRLPERHRLPVVLCDLEGLTYEEAARRLRWTVPQVRHRLADGRGRLAARLARRGFVPSAIVGVLASEAKAALPPALVRSAMSAAAGSAPATVSALVLASMRGMAAARASTAALAALALASAGVIALASGRHDGPKPAMTPTEAPRVDEVKAPAPNPGEAFEVRGVVVGPDGRPVPGAKLAPVNHDEKIRPYPEATAGPDGRFSIRIPESSREASTVDKDLFPWLVASSPGFGFGWVAGLRRPGEVTIRLVEEGRPIEGRVIDLEGRPVAGANVELMAVRFFEGKGGQVDDSGDLSPWVARLRGQPKASAWRDLGYMQTAPGTALAATTGADGRFRIAGIGRERIARLMITGPSIVATEAYAMTRDEPEIQVVDESFRGLRPVIFRSARFDQPVAPSKPVRGVARDKDTGRPIAGLTVEANVYNNENFGLRGIEAKTDEQGRYTLTGLPKAAAYRVFVAPGPGFPYANATFKVAASDAPGLDPVTFDFALKRSVIVRGRVTDKETGRPVAGHVNAFVVADSPGIGDYPGFVGSLSHFAYLDEDGRYELATPPGRVVIACRSDIHRYLTAVGVETIAGYDPKKYPHLRTEPDFRGAVNYHILAQIHLDPEAESATLDLQVDPGRTVRLAVVDPEGRPIGDLRAEGTSQTLMNLPIGEPSSTVVARGLDPAKPRRVTVFHDGRKLVGSAWLKGDETSPVTLRLQPWGTITGRVLDDQDKEVRYRTITAGSNSKGTPLEEVGIFPGGSIGGGLALDKDGRFRLEGLVPGLKYAAIAGTIEIQVLGNLFQDVAVGPGEVKDLGDLKVKPLPPREE